MIIQRSMTFGVNALVARNLNAYDYLISIGPSIQCVRWKRKPIWLPTAKSKMFKVPVRPIIPDEDTAELSRLYNNYRTLMKSVKAFFIEQEEQRIAALDVDVVRTNAAKDFEICNYMNTLWNEQVAAQREQRLKQERKQREETITIKVQEKKERDLRIQEQVDLEIKKAKQEASTFITPENIDEAILKTLETIIDHNAAIDLQGNFYRDEPTNQTL